MHKGAGIESCQILQKAACIFSFIRVSLMVPFKNFSNILMDADSRLRKNQYVNQHVSDPPDPLKSPNKPAIRNSTQIESFSNPPPKNMRLPSLPLVSALYLSLKNDTCSHSEQFPHRRKQLGMSLITLKL